MPRTLDDLLDAAIHHEVLSQDMYRKAESVVSDPDAKRFLRTLVEEEEGHERTLKEIKAMEIYEGSVPLEDDSLVDAGASHGGEEAIASDARIEDVLRLALGREERARSLFESLARTAKHPELVTLFNKLAEEEQGHHDTLVKRFSLQTGTAGDEN